MSNELPSFSDNSEYESDEYFCNDPGLQYLVDEMMATEDLLEDELTHKEAAELMNSLREQFDRQGIEGAHFLVTVSGKLRPGVSYSGSGGVNRKQLKQENSAAAFPRKDSVGRYRVVQDEKVEIVGADLYAAINSTNDRVYSPRVGFLCEYTTSSGKAHGYLHPADIDFVELPRLTTEGARQIIAHYKSYCAEVEYMSHAVNQPNGLFSWLQSMDLEIPDALAVELEELRDATEIYIENLARFDEEPYSVAILGDVVLRSHEDGQTKYRHIGDTEDCYVYINGVELQEHTDEEGGYWRVCLRTQLLVDDEMQDDTLLIPLDSLMNLQPTLKRKSTIQDAFLSKNADQEEDEYAEQLYEEHRTRREFERLTLRSLHRVLELNAEKETLEISKDTTRLEEQLAVADALREAYNIPTLAWQDPERRARAASEYLQVKDKKMTAADFYTLTPEKQELLLRGDDEYQARFARDEAMMRDVAMAIVRKRQEPAMTVSDLEQLRLDIYNRMLVDYEEPAGSSWYELIDTVAPGELIARDHPEVQRYAQEAKEIERQQHISEAIVRNNISKELLGGVAIDLDDPSYRFYRSVVDDLAAYPYLTEDEKRQLIWQVRYERELPHETVVTLSAIAAKAARELA